MFKTNENSICIRLAHRTRSSSSSSEDVGSFENGDQMKKKYVELKQGRKERCIAMKKYEKKKTQMM